MRLQKLYIPDPTSPSLDPAYQIDLIYEDFRINLTDFPDGIQLENAPELYDGPTKVEYWPDSPTIKVYNETGDKQPSDYPVCIDDNTYIMFEEGFLKRKQFNEASELHLNLTFNQPVSNGNPIQLTDIARLDPLTPGIMRSGYGRQFRTVVHNRGCRCGNPDDRHCISYRFDLHGPDTPGYSYK